MQPEQVACRAQRGVCALPEAAGLPGSARLGVADGGDRDAGQRGQLGLGQTRRVPPGGEAGRQRAGGVGEIALEIGGLRVGDAGPGVAARAGHQQALRDQRAERLAAGQRREPEGPAELGAARRGLARAQGAVRDLPPDDRRDPQVLGQAGAACGRHDSGPPLGRADVAQAGVRCMAGSPGGRSARRDYRATHNATRRYSTTLLWTKSVKLTTGQVGRWRSFGSIRCELDGLLVRADRVNREKAPRRRCRQPAARWSRPAR
jgi:hypothetical protein